MKKISVIIPVKNRELNRIKKLYESFDSDDILEFIIVDYKSDKPIVFNKPKVRVIRYEGSGPWNKAHAINIGIKKSKGDFIMTVDVDIVLVDKLNFDLKEDSFYYTGDVRRISMDDLYGDIEESYKKSIHWLGQTNYASSMYGLANGGMQIYPKKFIMDWKGIDENLCYMGGMDNIVTLMAKKSNMKIVQLPVRLLHIEHNKKKQDNFKDAGFAAFVKSTRREYLNSWIENPRINDFFGLMKGANCPILDKLKQQYSNGVVSVNGHTRIMIAVINNKSYLPQSFVQSLMRLFQYTSRYIHGTEIKFVKACQVNHMRNVSIDVAISEGFDYLIQLDDDHIYEEDTIMKLLSHHKDFVTVPTKQRIIPFNPTQYRKIIDPIKQEGNFLYTEKNDGLVTCEASGPVAMLMSVNALKKLKSPYYYMHYQESPIGGDVMFCKQLKEKGYKIYVDTSINCPHMVNSIINSYGYDATVELNNGQL